MLARTSLSLLVILLSVGSGIVTAAALSETGADADARTISVLDLSSLSIDERHALTARLNLNDRDLIPPAPRTGSGSKTNAELLARGLPPKAPTRRYDPSRQRRQTNPSATPLSCSSQYFTVCCGTVDSGDTTASQCSTDFTIGGTTTCETGYTFICCDTIVEPNGSSNGQYEGEDCVVPS